MRDPLVRRRLARAKASMNGFVFELRRAMRPVKRILGVATPIWRLMRFRIERRRCPSVGDVRLSRFVNACSTLRSTPTRPSRSTVVANLFRRDVPNPSQEFN